jgi:hypothetical protein
LKCFYAFYGLNGGIVPAHHVNTDNHELLGLQGCFFGNQLSFVIQLTLAHVGTVTQVRLSGGTIVADSGSSRFIVSAALGTSLLAVSAFRIWHKTTLREL